MHLSFLPPLRSSTTNRTHRLRWSLGPLLLGWYWLCLTAACFITLGRTTNPPPPCSAAIMATLAPDEAGDARRLKKSLTMLPYDILLNITQHFDMQDVIALQSVSTMPLLFYNTSIDLFPDMQIAILFQHNTICL